MRGQPSFDDLGTPLHEVTFVVLDLETTGGSPETCAITEVGAVKVRGGECLGTFQTLVNPGMAIPPEITYLTGITQAMVVPAPGIEAVLPTFLEFIGDAVVVGHNVRFDIGFLNTALRRARRERIRNAIVDTCGLARRLVREEVPDCRLATLAAYFRTTTRPTHRALDDARATADLMHCLLERAGTLGVLALDDLLALPTTAAHPQVAKLSLVSALPRRPGVYLFKDGAGRVIYVGRATDIRRRVRSYFAGEHRRRIGQLLREAQSIDHIVCTGELEASVTEVRLIHQLAPRFNRESKMWRRYAYLKLTLTERFPRLSVVRVARDDGCLYLGPLASAKTARLVGDAIETAAPLRRSTARAVSETDYAAIVQQVVRGLTSEPAILLDPLCSRMRSLAMAERFEEAADARDRADALARAVSRQRRFDALRRAGRVTIEIAGECVAVLDGGRLVAAWPPEVATGSVEPLPIVADPGPLPREHADEVACVAAWLDARADRVRIIRCDGEFSWPTTFVPRFEPGRGVAA